jgi:hypothetical protein
MREGSVFDGIEIAIIPTHFNVRFDWTLESF